MLLMKLMKETMRNMVKVMSTQEATCKEKKLNKFAKLEFLNEKHCERGHSAINSAN